MASCSLVVRGAVAMLDAILPKLDSPPLASALDAAKARDVDAVGLIHKNVRAGCVVTVRVHSPVILTCCSGLPLEESPVRLRKADHVPARDHHGHVRNGVVAGRASLIKRTEPRPSRTRPAQSRRSTQPHQN